MSYRDGDTDTDASRVGVNEPGSLIHSHRCLIFPHLVFRGPKIDGACARSIPGSGSGYGTAASRSNAGGQRVRPSLAQDAGMGTRPVAACSTRCAVTNSQAGMQLGSQAVCSLFRLSTSHGVVVLTRTGVVSTSDEPN